jgi:hypothetical protein
MLKKRWVGACLAEDFLCGPPDVTPEDSMVGCMLIDFIAGSTATFTLTFEPTVPANLTVSGTLVLDEPIGGQVFDVNPDNNFAYTCMNMVRASVCCKGQGFDGLDRVELV